MNRLIFGLYSQRFCSIFTVAILFSSLVVGRLSAYLQTSDAMQFNKPLHTAINAIDNSIDRDLDKSEAALKLAMRDAASREVATFSLALLYLKRGNLDAVENFLRKANTLFPTPTLEQKSQLLRIQLSGDIAKGSESVTERFSDLVRISLDDNLTLGHRLASGTMLGTVIGMLEPNAAQSPIDPKVLNAAKDALLKSRNTELLIAFESSYRKSLTHATLIADWMAAHQELPLDETVKAVENLEEQLRAADQDRDRSVVSIRTETKERRKNIYQLSRKKDAIQQEVNAILFQWNCHPEVHNPIKPDRRMIQVPITERVKVGSHKVTRRKTKWVSRGADKGEWKEYDVDEVVDDYETRSRPQRDIDRDIDAIYLPLFHRYLALKAHGQMLRDQKAERELQFRYADAEILAAHKSMEALEEKGRNEQVLLNRLRAEAKIARQGVSALECRRTETAFRPPNFELFDFAWEAKALRSQLVATAN